MAAQSQAQSAAPTSSDKGIILFHHSHDKPLADNGRSCFAEDGSHETDNVGAAPVEVDAEADAGTDCTIAPLPALAV